MKITKRVRDSSENLKLQSYILRNINEGVCLVRASDLKIVYANPKFDRMFGYRRGELINQPIAKITYGTKEEIREKAGLIVKKLEKYGRNIFEILNIKKDGTPVWCRVTATVFTHEEFGKVWVAVNENITKEKSFKDKILESEKRFRELFEKASDAIVLFNFERKIIDANPKACKMFGLTKKQLIGLSPSDLIESEDTEYTKKTAAKVLAGKPVITEREVKRPDGSKIFVETNLSIVGEGIVQGIIRDVTEQKKARESILALNKRIASILDSITDGFFSVDKNWRFEYFNKTAEKLQAVPGKELLGRSLWEVYPILVGTELEKNYRKAMRTKKPLSFKIPSSMSGKTYKVHCYPNSFGLSVYFTDISLEEEVVKRQNEFISVASHELRTPLTSIYANIQVLQKYYSTSIDTKVLKIINNLSEETEKLLKLATNILDTSIIQTGKLKLTKHDHNINLIINEAVKNCLAISQKHTIVTKGKGKNTISVDKVRILQVLTNLLTNSIKYSPKTGKIVVHVKEDANDITISVQDFGVGIPKDKLEEVFNRFYRTTEGMQTAFGLGLGLFISYNIIKSHDGKMWVESEINKGSTFHFSLPK